MGVRHDFLIGELWILAWSASVQRARVYRAGLEPGSRDARLFRDSLVNYLSNEVIPKYAKGGIGDEEHYKHIEELVSYANSVGGKVLGPCGYKYGVAQKLLNLALKYHWCIGVIEEPPHCPVDRIVIGMTQYKEKINWTEIDSRAQYEHIIEDIRHRAGVQSLAMWELVNFDRR